MKLVGFTNIKGKKYRTEFYSTYTIFVDVEDETRWIQFNNKTNLSEISSDIFFNN